MFRSVLLGKSSEGIGLGLDHAPSLSPDEQLEDPGQGSDDHSSERSSLDAPPSPCTACTAVLRNPGLVDTQVKERPCCQSVTSQTALGSPGWRTSNFDPTPIGPLPSGRTTATVGSLSPQRSTSLASDHNLWG